MATKVTGLAWTTFSVGDSSNATQDIRNAVTDLTISTPRAVQDVTGIDKSAIERLLLLADYSIDPKGVFDTLATSGANNGAVLFTDYKVTRANSGELTWEAPGVGSTGTVPTWS